MSFELPIGVISRNNIRKKMRFTYSYTESSRFIFRAVPVFGICTNIIGVGEGKTDFIVDIVIF